MQFRSLLLVGVCAGFAIASSAFAAPQAVDESIVPAQAGATEAVTVAAPKSDADAAKKKKKLKPVAKKKDAKAEDPKVKAAKAKEAAEKEKAKLAAKAKAEKEKQLAAKKKEGEARKLAKAKAEKERKLAAEKAAKERKLAAEKAAQERKLAAEKAAKEREKAAKERQLAREKAEKEREIARAKAAEERRLAAEAKARAAEEKRLAKLRAEEERRQALARAEEQRRKEAEAARKAELVRLASSEITQTGNNGELRSEKIVEVQKPQGLFAGLFGGGVKQQQQAMLPETRALDAALTLKQEKKPFKVKPEFVPQTVAFPGYPSGTIVIDTAAHYLYLVESSSKARRYAIAVGKEGLQFKGNVKVGDKQEWPRWIPTKEMQQREPKKYGQYKDGMPGGGDNPLGARAIYLYQNGKDTHLRIHGTIAPETIGTDSSNGCFRMINDHVIDLYRRVPVGTNVVVL